LPLSTLPSGLHSAAQVWWATRRLRAGADSASYVTADRVRAHIAELVAAGWTGRRSPLLPGSRRRNGAAASSLRPARRRAVTAALSTSWLERAACRGRDPRWWFSTDRLDQAVAVAVRQRCPVRVQCLDEAVELEADGYAFGIRGGKTATERVASRRRSVITAPRGACG
jgi:hypothetical protein